MSALAEALTAAQRRALGAVEKAYVAGLIDGDGATKLLDSFGATDDVERGYLFAALEVVKMFGAAPPAEPKPANDWKSEPMSESQRKRIERDCDAKQLPHPDFAGMTKGQASEVIESLGAGTYDPDKWSIPF